MIDGDEAYATHVRLTVLARLCRTMNRILLRNRACGPSRPGGKTTNPSGVSCTVSCQQPSKSGYWKPSHVLVQLSRGVGGRVLIAFHTSSVAYGRGLVSRLVLRRIRHGKGNAQLQLTLSTPEHWVPHLGLFHGCR